MTRPSVILFALLLALAGCATTPSTSTGASSNAVATNETATPKQLKQGQIIVTLAYDTPERWAEITQGLARDYGLTQVGDFPLTSIRVQCVVFQVPEGESEVSVVEKLRADPRVESVQSNLVFDGLRGGHNDPYGPLIYGAKAIGADRAHRIATGKGVRIVVIDTGVDKDHVDLRGRVKKTQNFVEGGELTFARDRHGTAVAGVIAARADDGVGIYGVAPDAEVMVAKACWYQNAKSGKAFCSSWTLAKAIDFAINAEARVLNLSLGGPHDVLMERLINRAVELGITVIAAAAQEGEAPGFPASMANVIAVLASDAKGKVQAPSWVAEKAMIAAPGVDILSTAPRDSYDFFSGSSLATAQVSGVVALLIERRPDLTPARVAEMLRARGSGGFQTASSAHGELVMLDACAALKRLDGLNDC